MARFEIIPPVKGSVLSIETKRLILSVYKPSAAQAVKDYLVRNRAFHKPFQQRHGVRYFTIAEQKSYLKSDLQMFNRNTQVAFWITLPEDQREKAEDFLPITHYKAFWYRESDSLEIA